MCRARWALVGGSLLCSATAFAHAPPEATGIEWPSEAGAPSLVVRTNRGLIVKNGTAPLSLLCNDAYQANLSETVPFHATEGGLLVASYSGGLLRANADLCEFRRLPAPFTDQTLIDLRAHEEQTLYALTLPSDAAPGQVFITKDGGVHFSPGATSPKFGTSLAVAPGNEQTLYVAQLDLSDPTAGIPQIAVSRDAGQTFTTVTLELEAPEFRAFVLGVDPKDERRLFLRTEAGDSTLPERLLLSEDGGATFRAVFSGVGPLSLAIDESTEDVWVGGHDGLFRAQDGGKHFEPVSSSALSQISCLALHAGSLYACAFAGEFGVFASHDSATSFEPYVRFPDVTQPIPCSPDSQVATACIGAFEDWRLEQSQDPAPTPNATVLSVDSEATAEHAGTGCQVSFGQVGSTIPLSTRLLVLALVRVLRRRRLGLAGRSN
jgi:hypothetical protein